MTDQLPPSPSVLLWLDAIARQIEKSGPGILDRLARGLPISERRAAAVHLLRAHPERSNKWIASDAKIDDHTIAKLRLELENTGEIPALDMLRGRDGRTRSRRRPRSFPCERA